MEEGYDIQDFFSDDVDVNEVNKMMAALGANEEAAQQMIRDAKWENDMLKKDIGLLQVQKKNLLEKLESEKQKRESSARDQRVAGTN